MNQLSLTRVRGPLGPQDPAPVAGVRGRLGPLGPLNTLPLARTFAVDDSDVRRVGAEPRVDRLADVAEALQRGRQVIGPTELQHLPRERGGINSERNDQGTFCCA